MAIHYRTKGFILNKRDLSEADQIFTIFTEDFGRLEILGKAIRKIKSKLKSGMHLFTQSYIEFVQGKTYKILTDAITIKSFSDIKTDLKRLKVAFEISEVFKSLVKGQEKDERIWNLFKKVLQELDESTLSDKDCWLIYHYFLWNFYSILGYQPELNACSVCQKKLEPSSLYFNPKEGGVICSRCFKKTDKAKEISPNVVKILRLMLSKDIDFLKKLKIEKGHQKAITKISKDYSSFVKEGQA
jgi:DNA repair protein RecO (recombination protein O)